MDMNGVEIDSLMDFMKKPSNRQKLIAKRMQANGGDINKATQEVDNAILYGDLFKKIENHTATAEEKAKFNTLDQTPGLKETIQLAHEEERNGIERNNLAKTSVASRADAFNSNQFPSAPNLREHHMAALAAISSLDDKSKVSLAVNELPQSQKVNLDSGFAV